MGVYKFEALDPDGRIARGMVEGENARMARSRLRDMQMAPLRVEPVSTEADEAVGRAKTFSRRRLSGSELCLVTRQLATLLSAGLTVSQALTAVIEQSEKEYTREVLTAVRAEVFAGSSLYMALGKYPQAFPELYRSIVNAGEESGELARVMLRLADYTESRDVLKQKVVMAFIYPALVSVVALLVISGLLVFVVPQVVGVFEQSKQTLPVLTRLLIAVSDFLRAAWPYLLAALLFGVWAARKALAREAVRYCWHASVLRLPVFGRLARGLNTARLASTLAILVGSGVPILRAMQAAGRIVDNLPMRQAILDAAELVRDGSALSRALKGGNLFPPILIHLIASAEATGRLDAMLESAAAQQEREMESRIAIIIGLLEPALILLMGSIVLAIVLAILLPIIEMNQLIK